MKGDVHLSKTYSLAIKKFEYDLTEVELRIKRIIDSIDEIELKINEINQDKEESYNIMHKIKKLDDLTIEKARRATNSLKQLPVLEEKIKLLNSELKLEKNEYMMIKNKINKVEERMNLSIKEKEQRLEKKDFLNNIETYILKKN